MHLFRLFVKNVAGLDDSGCLSIHCVGLGSFKDPCERVPRMVVPSACSRTELVQFDSRFFAVAPARQIRREESSGLPRPAELGIEARHRETGGDEPENKSQSMTAKRFDRKQ